MSPARVAPSSWAKSSDPDREPGQFPLELSNTVITGKALLADVRRRTIPLEVAAPVLKHTKAIHDKLREAAKVAGIKTYQ